MVREEIKKSYHELASILSQKFDEILKMNLAENIQKKVEDPIIRQIANIPTSRMGDVIHQNVENNAWGQHDIEEVVTQILNRSGFDIRSVNQVRFCTECTFEGFGTTGVTGGAKTEGWRGFGPSGPNIRNNCTELMKADVSDVPGFVSYQPCPEDRFVVMPNYEGFFRKLLKMRRQLDVMADIIYWENVEREGVSGPLQASSLPPFSLSSLFEGSGLVLRQRVIR
ncbi:hypothetical protein PIB30_051092 [Stylosanthes scabra]|uniref:Uncharacterized protein n=1 Tax=Stylosanthes scabra TaxID=79078 RepID=A0ABU6ZGJ1_9FABA|nr:hypothetical protein [Stylosanthes scabra]